MALVALVISLLAMVATLIGLAAGMTGSQFNQPLWRVILMLPWVGFPITFVLLICFLIVSIVLRTRENRATLR